jgi:hypothetical protein
MSYQETKAAGTAAVVFAAALVFVFLLLAAQYESWALPVSVLLATPLAIFGAMLGLWLSRFLSPSYVNNVFAQIGFVPSSGSAAKNAMSWSQNAEGKSIRRSTRRSIRQALRPILMTSFAFILGVVPLVRARAPELPDRARSWDQRCLPDCSWRRRSGSFDPFVPVMVENTSSAARRSQNSTARCAVSTTRRALMKTALSLVLFVVLAAGC